jgi:Histidine kinase-like ATPase domain
MQLTIPPSPAHLADLRRAARASLRDVSSEVAEEMVVAVNEAATNAILYGSGEDQPVEVAVAVKADCVEATVLDHGPALPHHPGWRGTTPKRWVRVGGAFDCCTSSSTRCVWNVSGVARA